MLSLAAAILVACTLHAEFSSVSEGHRASTREGVLTAMADISTERPLKMQEQTLNEMDSQTHEKPLSILRTDTMAPPENAAQKQPKHTMRYYWQGGIFKPAHELNASLPMPGPLPFKDEHLRHTACSIDETGGVYIKFLIRSVADPTGSNSPCIHVDGDVPLLKVFEWYIENTYAHGPFLPPVNVEVEDYCLMRVDMQERTLGEKYYYLEAQKSPLRIMDTEWCVPAEFTKLCVVSNDRIPKGNYRPVEP